MFFIASLIILFYACRNEKKASIFAPQIKVSIIQNILNETLLANNHISVDCVVIGFDSEQLKVLLVKG